MEPFWFMPMQAVHVLFDVMEHYSDELFEQNWIDPYCYCNQATQSAWARMRVSLIGSLCRRANMHNSQCCRAVFNVTVFRRVLILHARSFSRWRRSYFVLCITLMPGNKVYTVKCVPSISILYASNTTNKWIKYLLFVDELFDKVCWVFQFIIGICSIH